MQIIRSAVAEGWQDEEAAKISCLVDEQIDGIEPDAELYILLTGDDATDFLNSKVDNGFRYEWGADGWGLYPT